MNHLKNKDIAKILGISNSAVSLAINNKPGVSEETRRKVLSLLGNDPSPKIAAPATDTDASTLLYVVHKRHGEIIIDKPFFSQLIETVQQEAAACGYSLNITYYTGASTIEDFLHTIDTHFIAGIVLLGTELLPEDLKAYKKLGIPLVQLDSSYDLESLDNVTIDNTTAIMKAFDYAYKMGHRRIGYLRSSIYISNFEHRFDGYKKALREFGLSEVNAPVFSLHSNRDIAKTEMGHILDELNNKEALPTCFLSDLDDIAIGAMQALQAHGYRVPDDVSIIGFDDITACEVCTPRLTTIRVNMDDIGRIATDILIDRIRRPHNYYTQTQVSSDLIIRDSVLRICQ